MPLSIECLSGSCACWSKHGRETYGTCIEGHHDRSLVIVMTNTDSKSAPQQRDDSIVQYVFLRAVNACTYLLHLLDMNFEGGDR